MRDELGHWLPGESGNAKGRPKTGFAIADLARGEVERRGLVSKLGQIASCEGEYAEVDVVHQIRCIQLLLAYAYGPPQDLFAHEQELRVSMIKRVIGVSDSDL